MFALKRNQVVITALVVMVAVAGYLNYVDDNNVGLNPILLNDLGEIASPLIFDDNEVIDVSSLQDVSFEDFLIEQQEVQITDDNPLIFSEDNSIAASEGGSGEAGDAVFVNKEEQGNDSVSFFALAKLEREQSRAKQKEILLELINNEFVEKDKKAESADAMLDIQKRIEKETAAETMIESKGFKDVFVRISDDSVDVVVDKESLSEAEIAQIEDIVRRKTGMETSAIRISPMKK